jgi:thiol-disulfide isomerase/thioredoxin
MKKDKKRTWIQYGVIALAVITLYVTGWHTDVIGFAQRGVLATGLMNPDVPELVKGQSDTTLSDFKTSVTKADFDLVLIDDHGEEHSLIDFKGKVIFFNMWATWCPPCIAEMPNIDKLHEEMGDEVAFVLLSLDQDFEKAKTFNMRKGYELPIYQPASSLPAMYESSSIPTTYIIDAAGNLALTHYGMADYNTQEFKDFLRGLK